MSIPTASVSEGKGKKLEVIDYWRWHCEKIYLVTGALINDDRLKTINTDQRLKQRSWL